MPDWLPPILDFTGDWPAYEEKIYERFRDDLLRSHVRFRDVDVRVRSDPRVKGKEAGFWHAISQGNEEVERTPDLVRCERIGWIRAMIECSDPALVRTWENKRGTDRRALIALPDFSYVVILARRKGYDMFLTAYSVEKEHRRRKLEKEWKENSRLENADAAPKDGIGTPSTHGR